LDRDHQVGLLDLELVTLAREMRNLQRLSAIGIGLGSAPLLR